MIGAPKFEPRLESLRGVAALIVATHHGMMAFKALPGDKPPVLSTLHEWVLELATNPGSAVLFFFVLSGYVLGQSLERDANYLRFIVRRAFRIMPAFLLSVFFAYACVTLIRIDVPPADLTEFFKRPFWPMPTIDQLKDNLVFRSSWINGPTWSISWEIIGSIFLPVLVYLHSKTSGASKFFTIGPSSVGASMMIGAVLSSQDFLNWLRLRPLRFLGRVSYSFYLFHWPVFYLTAIAVISTDILPHGATGNWIVCLASIALALVLSALIYRLVELPLIELGRRLTSFKIVRVASLGPP